MEHEVLAAEPTGSCAELAVAVGDAVEEGQLLLTLDAGAAPPMARASRRGHAGGERADLRAVRERHEIGLDAARPGAVAKRRERGRRTARENLAELLDEGTLRRVRAAAVRRPGAAALARGADRPHARRRPGRRASVRSTAGACVAMSYDYTVLAGTQGMRNHVKKDRLFELAERRRLPVVLFAEGGGGRPGDVDMPIVAGLDCRAFDAVRSPQRAGAARGHRLGLLLCGQRRAARLLRRGDRDRGLEHRHGRSGDDRGRRPGRLRARRGGPDRRAARKRRGRPARARRARGGGARPSATCPTSAAPREPRASAATSGAARADPRAAQARL